jgi:hypothetical protein
MMEKGLMSARQILRNERGDVLVIALALVAISFLSTLTLLSYAHKAQNYARAPRVKSVMASIESKVRTELLTPGNYPNCTTGRVGCDSGFVTVIGKIQSLTRTIAGAVCPASKPACGILVTVKSFPPIAVVAGQTVSRAQVNIHYEGSEMALHDIDVTMDVPADIMQSSGVYKCPTSNPKFNGFLPNGAMDCQPLPARLGMNDFVDTIDLEKVVTVKSPLPNTYVKCPTDQFVNYVDWGTGGTVFTSTCAQRADPFTVYGFTPGPAPTGNMVYTPNPDY